MKIIVVGKGGREHALVQTLKNSPGNPELFACPGSDAIGTIATCFPFENMDTLIERMKSEKIDFCVAGEESYLVRGLADRCEEAGIGVWGPRQCAAQLESSKLFAKDFMLRHNIPTGSFQVVESPEDALKQATEFPCVLKYNGLAAGKGVAVCFDKKQVEEFVDAAFEKKSFGEDMFFIEEYLEGKEVSIICAVSGEEYMTFPAARDYKRLKDHDEGPNTGGMGAVASSELLGNELLTCIEKDIIQPTIKGLNNDRLDYHGFLYFGLILTNEGPKVLEFNCRFGDPEAQAVLPMIMGDFAGFLQEASAGTINPERIQVLPGWSVCLVMASKYYPNASSSGDVIEGFDEVEGVRLYHAGTRLNVQGSFETHGGRVLAVAAHAEQRTNAVSSAYQALQKIFFEGAQWRSDIGKLHFESERL